ncbi:MAG: hypothetical protein ACREV5_05135, partial [Steroidobacter sp.]
CMALLCISLSADNSDWLSADHLDPDVATQLHHLPTDKDFAPIEIFDLSGSSLNVFGKTHDHVARSAGTDQVNVNQPLLISEIVLFACVLLMMCNHEVQPAILPCLAILPHAQEDRVVPGTHGAPRPPRIG